MLVQFGNNWIQKIPQTAKLDEAVSNYFQIGQHVVLLHIQSSAVENSGPLLILVLKRRI